MDVIIVNYNHNTKYWYYLVNISHFIIDIIIVLTFAINAKNIIIIIV